MSSESSSRSIGCAQRKLDTDLVAVLFLEKPARLLAVAGRVGDDLVDHICASHLVQCLDVLDDLMRDPVALGLVLLYF